MAVIPLSRITKVKLWLLKTALTRPGIPEWKKVESPIKEITFLSVALEKPQEVPTEDPMHIKKSAMESGGNIPSV